MKKALLLSVVLVWPSFCRAGAWLELQAQSGQDALPAAPTAKPHVLTEREKAMDVLFERFKDAETRVAQVGGISYRYTAVSAEDGIYLEREEVVDGVITHWIFTSDKEGADIRYVTLFKSGDMKTYPSKAAPATWAVFRACVEFWSAHGLEAGLTKPASTEDPFAAVFSRSVKEGTLTAAANGVVYRLTAIRDVKPEDERIYFEREETVERVKTHWVFVTDRTGAVLFYAVRHVQGGDKSGTDHPLLADLKTWRPLWNCVAFWKEHADLAQAR